MVYKWKFLICGIRSSKRLLFIFIFFCLEQKPFSQARQAMSHHKPPAKEDPLEHVAKRKKTGKEFVYRRESKEGTKEKLILGSEAKKTGVCQHDLFFHLTIFER